MSHPTKVLEIQLGKIERSLADNQQKLEQYQSTNIKTSPKTGEASQLLVINR
ncbi:MAG: hypothetical protein AB1589_17285 [Cyanobacteriota bacterium]